MFRLLTMDERLALLARLRELGFQIDDEPDGTLLLRDPENPDAGQPRLVLLSEDLSEYLGNRPAGPGAFSDAIDDLAFHVVEMVSADTRPVVAMGLRRARGHLRWFIERATPPDLPRVPGGHWRADSQ